MLISGVNTKNMTGVSFKIILVGEGDVGKSMWTSKIQDSLVSTVTEKGDGGKSTQVSDTHCTSHIGSTVYPIHRNTTKGPVTFNVWDCADVDLDGDVRDSYYRSADGAILMCDLTCIRSYDSLTTWRSRVRDVEPSIHFIVCGNKMDRDDCIPDMITESSVDFCEISAAKSQNIHQPLLLLARKMTGDPELEFI